jgi:Mn-dependent DtxR family transcriptional regulator
VTSRSGSAVPRPQSMDPADYVDQMTEAVLDSRGSLRLTDLADHLAVNLSTAIPMARRLQAVA